jgi:hypothetical protein
VAELLLGVVLAGVLVGCSRDGASGGLTGGGAMSSLTEGQVVSDRGVATVTAGIITGRVFTKACGGPLVSTACGPTNYRGELVFCLKKDDNRVCPAGRVDATGRYQIRLRPGRYYLASAPGSGNVVQVKPRWVVVGSAQTTTVNINGGNLMM